MPVRTMSPGRAPVPTGSLVEPQPDSRPDRFRAEPGRVPRLCAAGSCPLGLIGTLVLIGCVRVFRRALKRLFLTRTIVWRCHGAMRRVPPEALKGVQTFFALATAGSSSEFCRACWKTGSASVPTISARWGGRPLAVTSC